jgi:acetyl-CoA acyltransferase
VHPVDLGATVLRGLAERTGLDPALVEDVIWGCVTQTGEQAVNVARNTVLAAGWPEGVPATTVDRQCGSSQQAVHFAAAGIIAGHYDVVVAGGVESMTRVPMGAAMTEGTYGSAVLDRYASALADQGATTFNQGLGAEDIATRWGLTREELDSFALTSHERAAAAVDAGRFDDQIVPVAPPDGVPVRLDEGIRRGSSMRRSAHCDRRSVRLGR